MRAASTLRSRRPHPALVAVVVALALAGCGSESPTATPGDAVTSTPNPPPDSPAAATGGPIESLEPTATRYAVTGVVRDAGGAPVARTMVTASSLDTPSQPVPELAVLTDARGHYGWPGLKPGRYQLTVSTPTGPASTKVTVPRTGSVTADLTVLAK